MSINNANGVATEKRPYSIVEDVIIAQRYDNGFTASDTAQYLEKYGFIRTATSIQNRIKHCLRTSETYEELHKVDTDTVNVALQEVEMRQGLAN